jgi:hypothetical protein
VYSVVIGVWKSIKNNLIVFAPSIIAAGLAFVDALPPGIKVEYALPLGLVTYFLKNWHQNKN